MLTPLTPIGLAVFKTTGADGGEFGSMSGNERAGWDGAEAGPDGVGGGGDDGQQPGVKSPPPLTPGPDLYTDPVVKKEAIRTLTSTEVRSLQRSKPLQRDLLCALPEPGRWQSALPYRSASENGRRQRSTMSLVWPEGGGPAHTPLAFRQLHTDPGRRGPRYSELRLDSVQRRRDLAVQPVGILGRIWANAHGLHLVLEQVT